MDDMSIGAAPAEHTDEGAIMSLACTLYEQGAWAETFRLLRRLSASGERSAPLLYNMALCLDQAGQTERALSCLEKALSSLRGGRRERRKPTGDEETLRILYECQCARAGYCFPMRMEEAACLPDYARERILRLMITLCARLGDAARVRSLAASLPGKHFDDVEKALTETAERES